MKVIFHLDMDKFFVAVEQLHQPHLRGKPVAVGGGRNGGGVITTCSYEARRYGVHSGMPAHEALKLCPQLIFVHSDPSKYLDASCRVMSLLQEFTERVEPVSVDEAFLDVTDTVWVDGVEALGLRIKQRVKDETGLTASIGAGPNRLVAKMACEMHKPDGFTYLPPEKIADAFRDLPVRDLYGVGPSTESVLLGFGIRTAGQLAAFPESILCRRFGKWGSDLQRLARGEGSDEIQTPNERAHEKSMGHEYTFSQDLVDSDLLMGSLHLLCERVARRLRAKDMAGRIVTIRVRYHGFETHVHGRKLKHHINHEADIFGAASVLFEEIYQTSRPVRLLGVSVSELASASGLSQQELFAPPVDSIRLATVYDSIRERYGLNSIGYASGMLNSSGGSLKSRRGASAHVISVGYRPFFSKA